MTVILRVVWCWYSQDIDKAERLKAQLDSRGFIISAELLHHLAVLSAEHKQDLAEALKFKQQLCVLYSIPN